MGVVDRQFGDAVALYVQAGDRGFGDIARGQEPRRVETDPNPGRGTGSDHVPRQ